MCALPIIIISDEGQLCRNGQTFLKNIAGNFQNLGRNRNAHACAVCAVCCVRVYVCDTVIVAKPL